MSVNGLSSVSYALIKTPRKSWMRINHALIISVIVLLVWSAFANIDIMVFAIGKVVTASNINTVQHLEGGIVDEIFVKKGDTVKVGDPLLNISNINIITQLAEVQNRLQGIDGALFRLNAEISVNEELKFDETFIKKSPDIARNEQELFKENKRTLNEQLSLLIGKLGNNRLEQNELKKQIALASQSIELMKEELALSESIFETDAAIPKVKLLQLEREVHVSKSDKQRLTAQLLKIQNEESSIRQETDSLKSKYVSEAIVKRNELENKRSELLEIIAGASDKSVRSIVRSPVDGVVNQVLVNTIGGVVQSGMDLIEIVPNNADYLIDTKIKPEDIALIVIGQAANVRLTAYDFSIYGSLKGEVDYISADTLEEKDGDQYYAVHVRIDNSIVNEDHRYPVLPGMIANVDIITGKRTILSYLTKPIVKTKERALRED